MLALSRKQGESIMIGNDIEITILDIRNDQVKIGISAPKQVGIYRKEIYLQIQEENKQKWESMTIEEHMEYYISQGNDKKSAMKLVAKDRGVSKRDIYNQLIK